MKALKWVLIATAISASAFAAHGGGGKGGGGGAGGGGTDPAKAAFKESAAGFLHESIEHSIRRMMQLDAPAAKDDVTNVEANRVSLTDVEVTLVFKSNPTLNYRCILFDDFSKSGTVLKKEIICSLK